MKDYLLIGIVCPKSCHGPKRIRHTLAGKAPLTTLFIFQTLFVPDKRLEANTSAEEPSSLLPVTKPPQPLLTKVFKMQYVLSTNSLLY